MDEPIVHIYWNVSIFIRCLSILARDKAFTVLQVGINIVHKMLIFIQTTSEFFIGLLFQKFRL